MRSWCPSYRDYVAQLEEDARARGARGLSILRSDGGRMRPAEAATLPALTVLSGPAAGVIGAGAIARDVGLTDFITFDMGGTSTDVCLNLDGSASTSRETRIGNIELAIPIVDIVTVGAGGGSIAHVPEATGALRVGPKSAGADPGPACYGRGGAGPTVTDANLLLGFLPPRILAGELSLDIEAAAAALEPVASSLDVTLHEAAEGIYRVVNENMLGALRVVSSQRGHDPRRMGLIAFGGAGPMHAAAMAEILGTWPVVVPPNPGVLCALGCAIAEYRAEFSQAIARRLEQLDPTTIVDVLDGMREQVAAWLSEHDVGASGQGRSVVEADLRYFRQGFELTIELSEQDVEDIESGRFDSLGQRFAEDHRRLYGFALDTSIELVNLRCVALARADQPELRWQAAAQDVAAVIGEQELYWDGGWHAATIYDRRGLELGRSISGPALVVEPTATTVVPPGHRCVVDESGCLLMHGAHASTGPRADTTTIDRVSVDIIEGALKHMRFEMDAVVCRAAMSTVIREQHDEFPCVTDPSGNMIVGQFVVSLDTLPSEYEDVAEGDVFLFNDPYRDGAVSQVNDWIVALPIIHSGTLVGWAAMFGHMTDCGGPVPGSMPTYATSIFGEGLIIPPVRLYRRGELQSDIVKLILKNVRQPDYAHADLMALVAGCRVAERRIQELCERFGGESYLAAVRELLDRTRRAAAELIGTTISEEPRSFEDYIDDDGLGNGPHKLRCTVWREQGRCVVDWAGTDPQCEGPANYFLGTRIFQMSAGIYLIISHDPQILYNDGYAELFDVRIPSGSLLQPEFPAALGNRTHALGRMLDVFGAALGRSAPQFMTAAGFSSSPHLLFNGRDSDGSWFLLIQIGFGGLPGRPVGDGPDAHSLWPLCDNIPVEYLETNFPLVVESCRAIADSGGAGLHRGGNGLETRYRFLADGEISIHDDRWLTYPWGVLGGKPGGRSSKDFIPAAGRQRPLPAKTDHVSVRPGDRLVFRTWGGGGWGDPLERDPQAVGLDVRRGLVTPEKARADYGVALLNGGHIDHAGTESLRPARRQERGEIGTFDFGPPLEELLENCQAETGLTPPTPPGPLYDGRG